MHHEQGRIGYQWVMKLEGIARHRKAGEAGRLRSAHQPAAGRYVFLDGEQTGIEESERDARQRAA